MRSWQPIVGIFLGYLLGKYLSVAIFFLSAFPLISSNLSGSTPSFWAHCLAFLILAVTSAIAVGIWLLVNFFALSAWLPKSVKTCAPISGVMIAYTALSTLSDVVFNGAIIPLPIPFWIYSGWV